MLAERAPVVEAGQGIGRCEALEQALLAFQLGQHEGKTDKDAAIQAAAALLDDLADRGVPPELREEVRQLLAQVEFLRYAPQLGDYGDEIDRLREKARDVLGRVRPRRRG